MSRFPMLLVASLLGFAVSAPAQIDLVGQFGRHISVSARLGHRGPVFARERCAPPACEPVRRHGYYRTVCEQVYVPGCYRSEYVPAVYGWVLDHCGRRRWDIVQPACTRQIWVPAHYETVTRRVFVGC